MGVPAFLRLSDSGVRLDPGLRRVLEAAFCVDLSGVRLHAGPRTKAERRIDKALHAAIPLPRGRAVRRLDLGSAAPHGAVPGASGGDRLRRSGGRPATPGHGQRN